LVEKKDAIILKFLEIPVPIGTAGAFIWAMASFIQMWDPYEFKDLEDVFALFWMKFYTLLVISALIMYYIYIYVESIRLARLNHYIRNAELVLSPPEGMVLVPEGPFKYGLQGREIFLPSFFIDKYLVANEDYKKFIDDTGHTSPANWKDDIYPSDKSRHPVTNISWFDAKEFCEWRSKRMDLKIVLPTEEQWEKAARGPFGYPYPWGKNFDPKRCNIGQCIRERTTPIDAYPRGKSPYNCFDMCGNVWEWTNTFYDPNEEFIVVKGGSHYFDEGFASLWIRYHDPCRDKWFDLGFRCAHLI
jgi:formylglycine-generating enzyme required for sulfatase activity